MLIRFYVRTNRAPLTLTYDLNSADFQLASTSDLSMRNRYNVELKATIDVKDGG